jgi:hypothetical protein
METQPAIAAIIEISVDTETDTYKTSSYIEVAEEFSNENTDLPRDVLLGMVYELELMSKKIMKKAEIDEDEMSEYLKQRKLISEETEDVSPSQAKKKKDAIDRSIDHLFEDPDEDNTGL